MRAYASTPQHALGGIALLVAAVACFAVLDTTTKFISLSVPVLMALWFRYAFQAIATTVAMLPKRGWSLFRTAHPRFQCLRGVLLLTSSMLAFFSLKYMPVGEFTAIVMITPLVITLMASIKLGERVSMLRWALVVGGFLGTLTIIRPGGDTFDWTMLLPIGLVISNAWFQILTSQMARTEDPVTMHFYTGWVGTLLASLALPFAWNWLDSWTLWVSLGLMGLMGTIGHFMMILAYARTPVSTLTPFLYAQIGFAMLGGWLAFSHVPDQASMIGMGMIAVCGAAGAWLAVRESRVIIQPTES
ncbi:DMT family transporter [Polaromonas sp.]|uniref:DMT family transporter n=1 Tax=Polaromonas sp. TaxID=1869339 RepID=UPI001857A6A9|nr:DMT family transporter [Polaromonas sp.]NML86698.1 DMT family transporter [Polaromonas sp.]